MKVRGKIRTIFSTVRLRQKKNFRFRITTGTPRDGNPFPHPTIKTDGKTIHGKKHFPAKTVPPSPSPAPKATTFSRTAIHDSKIFTVKLLAYANPRTGKILSRITSPVPKDILGKTFSRKTVVRLPTTRKTSPRSPQPSTDIRAGTEGIPNPIRKKTACPFSPNSKIFTGKPLPKNFPNRKNLP